MGPGGVDSSAESSTLPYGACAEEALCAAAAPAAAAAAVGAIGDAAAIFMESPEGATSFRAVSSANGGFAKFMPILGMVCAESQEEVVSDRFPGPLKASASVPCEGGAAERICELSALVKQAVDSLVVLDADMSDGSCRLEGATRGAEARRGRLRWSPDFSNKRAREALELVGGKLRLMGERAGPRGDGGRRAPPSAAACAISTPPVVPLPTRE